MEGRAPNPLLECVELARQFGTLHVLHNVSFALYPGEIVGLTGQSGAGKSVLVRLLSGLDAPDSGTIMVDGCTFASASQAQQLGLAVIHQQPVLVEHLDATSTIFLGHEGGRRRWSWLRSPNQRELEQRALRILAHLGVTLPSIQERVGNLSGEQRHMLAIAQVVARQPKVVVVDDPSGQLRPEYQQALLNQLREWRSQGVAILFSSQNLDHLFASTSRILVLRHGRLVADEPTASTTREQIVQAQIASDTNREHTPLIWALDSFYRARQQAETLSEHQHVLEHDLAAQNALNRQLIAQLAEQVSSLDRANLALQDAQRRLLTEREQERKALARELHDQVIQDLVSLNYDIDDLHSESHDPAAVQTRLTDLRREIRTLISTLRTICGELRPPTIDSLGLEAAIQSWSSEWGARANIAVDVQIDSALGRLPEAVEISLFRIVQEALSNVRKHAQASHVSIHLRLMPQRTIQLTIADNGRGLAAPTDLAALAASGHYGLLGISERVALVHGRFRSANRPGGGTLIEVEVPQQS